MQKHFKNLAFTLVELIVVITILTILGTIAFLSYQGYSSSARDSSRTSDISNIKTSLELFVTKSGIYPWPSSYTGITYSGGLARNQGTFGTEPFKQLGDINKLPKDPLEGNEYTYSVANNKAEYEIAGVYEGSIANKELINKSFATKLDGTTRITGTYNGVVVYVQTGSYNFNVFTPTIINGNLNILDLQQIITNNELVLNGSNKLPSSYITSNFKNGLVSLGISDILISTGSLTDLKSKTQSGIDLRKTYLTKLQSILTGSSLKNNYIDIINLDSNNPNSDLVTLNILNGKGISGGNNGLANSQTPTIINTCTTQPSYSNATFITGTPTEQNQAWTQTGNLSTPCRYSCNDGYTGSTCTSFCNYTYTKTTYGSTPNNPFGIDIDSAGNIYMPDYNWNNVVKVTPDGTATVLGTTGQQPYDVTVDPAGNVYTPNSTSNNVTKITPDGTSTVLASSVFAPRSIVADGSGNVYVSTSSTVIKIDQSGTKTTLASGLGAPYGIIIDGSGNLYTANFSSNNITKITPSGIVTTYGYTGANPYSVAVDSDGNAYTADYNGQSVTKITPDGISTTIASGLGIVWGITIDSLRNLYVTKYAGGAMKITQSGVVTTLGTTSSTPRAGIQLDSFGNVYVASNSTTTGLTKFTRSSCN